MKNQVSQYFEKNPKHVIPAVVGTTIVGTLVASQVWPLLVIGGIGYAGYVGYKSIKK